jgi:hypothetical protein
VDQRRADLAAGFGERGGAVAVDREGLVDMRLRRIDRRIGGGIDDDIGPRRDHRIARLVRAGEVDRRALGQIDGETGRPLAAIEFMGDLTGSPDDKDAGAHA